MTPLPLDGIALQVEGAALSGRHVLRLRDPRGLNGPIGDADAAIVQANADIASARELGFRFAVLFGCSSGIATDFSAAAHLDPRFGYLADGDVIAMDSGSKRFRVLYRRSSVHNSFLVTERCNHYCLMCSQPPKNIDDGWIIDEISAAIDVIEPSD